MRNAAFRTDIGITLVELLVVMVILSLAIGIVVPSMNNRYEAWMLRNAGRRTAAFFRMASDIARRDGTDIAAYYADHHFRLIRNGQLLRELELPGSVIVQPGKGRAAVFLPTGQIIAPGPFSLENNRGRKIDVQFGPLPGQVDFVEVMR